MTTRYAPRHLKQQPGLVARSVPVTSLRTSTVLATGAALTVPASMGAVALAGSAGAATATVAPATHANATAVKTAKKATTASVVVLRYGAKGSAVRTLQAKLGTSVDGSFGPQTLSAVRAYQAKKGLSVDGVVGPGTWKALGGTTSTPAASAPATCNVSVLRYGAKGSLVRTLQTRLGTSADGSFGPQTLAAVRAYQAKKGLSVDGVVGPGTWKSLGGFPCGTGGGTGGGNGGGGTTPPPSSSPDANYKLPFPSGVSHRISQGPSGSFSHNDRYSKYAIDFAMPNGSTVVASRSGTVYKAGWDRFGGGNSVMVRDATGSCMQYNHLSSMTVRTGQAVTQGQQVGRSGNTGNSTGPHLHFGLVECSSFVSVQVPNTVERGTSYPTGVYAVSQNG